MNKRGIAISSVVYMILITFILLIASIIILLGTRNMALNRLKDEVRGEVTALLKSPYIDPLLGTEVKLGTNMIPVIINDTGKIIAADINDPWHSYGASNWANAVVVKSDTNVIIDEEILMEDILQMYVYIPRFKYEVFSSNIPVTINVEFENKNVEGYIKSTIPLDYDLATVTGQMLTHPAFSYVDTDGTPVELDGFWVGKFEMGYNDGEDETTTDVQYVIKANVNSVHSTDASTMYDKINDLSTSNMDVHMIKNMEWGAIAYLSQSIYGICPKDGNCDNVKVENNSFYNSTTNDITTGCGFEDNRTSEVCTDDYKWNMGGIVSSTTHNMSGVYDLAGGRREYVMLGLKDDVGFDFGDSGFTDEIPEKYYDLYEPSTSATDFSTSLLGDAIRELNPVTTTWYQDRATFAYDSDPWLNRGYYTSGEEEAGIFAFYDSGGGASSRTSTRATVWVK